MQYSAIDDPYTFVTGLLTDGKVVYRVCNHSPAGKSEEVASIGVTEFGQYTKALQNDKRHYVLAGVGHGNGPGWLLDLLSDASSRGIAVVRSSRLNAGTSTLNLEVDDGRLGLVAARSVNPQRSRLLLQLLLHRGLQLPTELQAIFDAI